jgi:hypothetical protein
MAMEAITGLLMPTKHCLKFLLMMILLLIATIYHSVDSRWVAHTG